MSWVTTGRRITSMPDPAVAVLDASHAVRILSALANGKGLDGGKLFVDTHGSDGYLIIGLMDVATAVMKKLQEPLDKKYGSDLESPRAIGVMEGRFDQVLTVARAVLPHMKSAGMDIPA